MTWWDNLHIETKVVVGASVALLVWLSSGMLWGGREAPTTPATQVPEVQVARIALQPYARTVTISGFTEAEDNALLAAQTAGRILATPATRGQEVTKGTLLVALDPADRLVRLKAAEAELSRTGKLAKAARALAKEGYMAGTVLAEREANYQAAVEKIAAAKLDMRYTDVTAPFDGVVEDVMVSEGDFVGVGTPVVKLVGRREILLVGHVAQGERGLLALGSDVSATLLDGTNVPATLRAVATDADPVTRTYRVEAVIDGTTYPVPTGMSAKMIVPAGTVNATRLAHDWLVLNDAGALGVMLAKGTSPTVASFEKISPLADTPAGVWVSGLDTGAPLITLGQAALKDGATVRAVFKEAP